MTDTQLRIGIMICTANRPKMLENCLNSLARQEIHAEWDVEICVVENDDGLHSAHAIAEVTPKCPFPIHHLLETRRGIPFARNRTLKEALERRYDWIALIDDDEVAVDGWLKAHLETVERYGADVSYGALKQEYERQPPKWWPRQNENTDPEGTSLTRASCGNVLFSKHLISADGDGLRFDQRLLHGYEDLDFFERAVWATRKIVWCPDAIAVEKVPASRVEPKRLLSLIKSSAAAHAQVAVIRYGSSRALMKFLPKGLKRIAFGLLIYPLHHPVRIFSPQIAARMRYYAMKKIARGRGNLLGLTAGYSGFYDKIDGH